MCSIGGPTASPPARPWRRKAAASAAPAAARSGVAPGCSAVLHRNRSSRDGVQCAAHSDPALLGVFSSANTTGVERFLLVLPECTQPQARTSMRSSQPDTVPGAQQYAAAADTPGHVVGGE
jgi:hypothetical protein